ncbi:MAG: HAMP domain-containing histidine kinase [Candidatus Riflebacteria bacterium]|nr:HAMP domain-containing histidine kinase [Candidatus Riflebacteria bacterium]
MAASSDSAADGGTRPLGRSSLAPADSTGWALRLVRFRWWVPPGIVLGAAVAAGLGLTVRAVPIFLVACFVLAYNGLFHLRYRPLDLDPGPGARPDPAEPRFDLQVGCDTLALLALIHLTGGASSPLLFVLAFHVVFAATLLPRRAAHGIALLAVGGAAAVVAAAGAELVTRWPLPRGALAGSPGALVHPGSMIVVFGLAVLGCTYLATGFVEGLRLRMADLTRSRDEAVELNEKLHTLYVVAQAIVSKQRLDQVLDIAKIELARVMEVEAVSVKLVSDDGRYLRYAATYGLPDTVVNEVIDLWKSPLNRRVVQGEMFVTGRVSEGEMFQFGEDLVATGLTSVLFVPLPAESKVIGVLGAYSRGADRFEEQDVQFFRLAADLVGIAVWNARAYEAIESLMTERTRFLLQIAHNFRAPLAAAIAMLEVVQGGFLGEVDERQRDYLARIDRRVKSLSSLLNDVLALAKSRTQRRRGERSAVDLSALTRKVHHTFQGEATRKSLSFELAVHEGVLETTGDAEMLEQMLENLVSNAIKYTGHGVVRLTVAQESDGLIRIEVQDSGMGIPKEAMPRLFTEFFRAPNARSSETIGTGLGLALVRETVDQHGGKIHVESEEGRGTTFTVRLPAARSPAAG